MVIMLSLNLVIVLFIGVAISIVGLLVYLRDRSNSVNIKFAFSSLFITLWLVFNYVGASPEATHFVSLWVNRLLLIVAGMAVLFGLEFIMGFCGWRRGLGDNRLNIFWVVGICVWALCLTPMVVADVYIENNQAVNEFGPLAFIYFAFLFLSASALVIAMIVGHFKLNGNAKKQLDSISKGFSLTVLIIIIGNAILPIFGNNSLISYAPISLLIVVITTAYTISAYRLFDLRIVITRTFAYALTISCVVVGYSYLSHSLNASLVHVSGSEGIGKVLNVAIITVALLVFGPLKRYFHKATDRLFYQDAYDPQSFLNNLNAELVNTGSMHEILSRSSDVILSHLKPTFVFIVMHDKLKGASVHKYCSKDIEISDDAIKRLQQYVHYHNVFTLESDQNGTNDDLVRSAMIKHQISMVVGLVVNNERIGLLILGDRKSGSAYSHRDTQLLETAANSIAISAQNSLRLEEISQFNETLEKKIDDATRQLQRTNEKLKALDQSKDDFISMASHQLRTPLTSVKGYLSMVIEGDAGKITDLQRSMLEQSFNSADRMAFLIADLLNLSRLKSGKFVIENKPTMLPDLVQQELAQLMATAEARGLKLYYEAPNEFPMLMIDETKIRQVIMNFLDNAIYYTPSGGEINVKLEVKPGSVEYTVKDNGIGVAAADQHNLFTKFYRASNARHARPDGTGLGLFMARKVIVAQGGAIIFKSKLGKGSTFGFSIPRKFEIVTKSKDHTTLKY